MDPIREKGVMQASEILKNRAFDRVKLRKLIFPAYSSPRNVLSIAANETRPISDNRRGVTS